MEKWNVISEESKSVPQWQQHDGSEDLVDVKISRADQNFRVDILEMGVRGIRDQRTWHNRVFEVDRSLDVALNASIARAIDSNFDQCLLAQALSCARAKAVDFLADELGTHRSKPVCTVFEFRHDNTQDEVSVEVIISRRSGNIRAEIIEKNGVGWLRFAENGRCDRE